MADMDTSVITPGLNGYYNRVMLQAATPLLLHLRFAQVKDIPQGNGMVVKFRRYGLLAAATTPLTEGVTPNGSSLSITDISATCAQYGDFVTFSDVIEFATFDPFLKETADKLGQQAGNSLDQVARDVMIAGASHQYASSAVSTATVTASMTLTRDEVREAVRTLQGNDAKKLTKIVNPSSGFNSSPINAAYIGIIDHMTLFDLKNEVGWIPVEEYASNGNVMEGEVGAMDDVRFLMTTNGYSVVSSLTTVHKTLIMGQDYYGITRVAGKALNNYVEQGGGTYDPLHQRKTSGWIATFVAKVLNSNFGVAIEHGVTP
jgi:N4-gp56 family major capsid protein